MAIRLENKDAVLLKLTVAGGGLKCYIAVNEFKLNVLFIGKAKEIALPMTTGDRMHLKEWEMTYSEAYGVGYVVKDIVWY
jgi:sirohydrochlorin ferrochelatase